MKNKSVNVHIKWALEKGYFVVQIPSPGCLFQHCFSNAGHAFWISAKSLYSSHRTDIFWVNIGTEHYFPCIFHGVHPTYLYVDRRRQKCLLTVYAEKKAFAMWPWTEEVPCFINFQFSHWLEIAHLRHIIEALSFFSIKQGPNPFA